MLSVAARLAVTGLVLGLATAVVSPAQAGCVTVSRPALAADLTVELARGFAGEGERDDVPGIGGLGLAPMGDAAREHPRLARTGAREDHEWGGFGGHRLALGVVQPVEQRSAGHRPDTTDGVRQ